MVVPVSIPGSDTDPTIASRPNPDLLSCVAALTQALSRAGTKGLNDEKTYNQILTVLSKPFTELGSALKDIVVPDSDELDTTSAPGLVDSFAKQLAESAENPFMGILAAQKSAFEYSLTGIEQILANGGSTGDSHIVSDYYNSTKALLETIILDPTGADKNIAGLFLHAFSTGIPAVSACLLYLKEMRVTARMLSEEVSKLPPKIDFTLPNRSLASKLCQAEELLRFVEKELSGHDRFDRAAYQRAANIVCSARDDIFSGSFDQSFLLAHGKNFLGLQNYKAKDLQNIRLLPDPKFKLGLLTLKFLATAFEEASNYVLALFTNITTALDTIKALADPHVGQTLAVLIGVLRQQISGLRAELEAQGDGYKKQDHVYGRVDTDVAAQRAQNVRRGVDANTGIPGSAMAVTDVRTDVTSYLSTQAGAYVTLTALCFLMQKSTRVFDNITNLLQFNSSLMRAVQQAVQRFNVDDCGNPQSMESVVLATTNYLKAADLRLRENGSSDALNSANRDLIKTISSAESFLHCFETKLAGGQQQLANALEDAGALVGVAQQILRMSRRSDAGDAIDSLNLKRLLSQDDSVGAMDALLKALECFILSCGNPRITSIAKNALQDFSKVYTNRRSDALTMSTLDGIPRVAAQFRNNRRIQQLMRVLASIRGILDTDIDKICNTDKARSGTATPGSTPKNISNQAVGPEPLTPSREIPGYGGPYHLPGEEPVDTGARRQTFYEAQDSSTPLANF